MLQKNAKKNYYTMTGYISAGSQVLSDSLPRHGCGTGSSIQHFTFL